jgi:uncharacterized membrane protein
LSCGVDREEFADVERIPTAVSASAGSHSQVCCVCQFHHHPVRKLAADHPGTLAEGPDPAAAERADAQMYAIFKIIHILAVVVFLGNITVGIFWKTIADRTNDPRIIAYTLRGIIRADRWFTIPGVVVIVLAGIGTALIGGLPILGTGWIVWSIGLFLIAGAAFGPVARAQREMAALAQVATQGGAFDRVRYAALSRTWGVSGMIALIAPVLAVILMVAKPELPAFHR